MNFNRFFSNSYNLKEEQLKELIKSKKYLVYPIEKIELFKSNLNKLIEKGENSALTKAEFNLLQKGISDINQLNFQKIKLNSGTIVAVYLQNISKAVEIPNTEDLPDGTIKEYRGGIYEKVNGEWVPSNEKPEDTNKNPDQNVTDSNNPDNNSNSDQQSVDENQNPEENKEEGGNNPDEGGNDNQGEDGNNKNEDDNDLSGLEELFGDDNKGKEEQPEKQPEEQQPGLEQPQEQNNEEQQPGQLPGNNSYKTLEQHAKETPTEELQRFVQNQNNDDDLKQIAMKELASRGVTLENVEENKMLKKIAEKVEKIEEKLNGEGGEETVNQNPESPDKLNQDTLAEYNKTPGAQKPHSAEGGNKGEEIKVEGLGEEKRTSSVKPEGSNEAANKETEKTEEKKEEETKENKEEGKEEEKKNLPPWLKGKEKEEKKEEKKPAEEEEKSEKAEEKKEESEAKKDEKQVEGEQKEEQEKINEEEKKVDKEKNKK